MSKNNELTAKGFLKKLAGFSMASWLSAAISFLSTPILTRLFVPEEMGRINMFMTYMMFFQTICVLALDQTFMRFYNEELKGITKNNFLTYCLRINMGISAVAAVVIAGGYQYFSVEVSGEVNYLIPICLAIVVFSYTFLRMSSISSRMQKNVLQYTLQIVSITVVEKIFFIFATLYRPTHKAAIIVMTIGFVALAAVMILLKYKDALGKVQKVPAETTKVLLGFALPYMPVGVLSWLNGSIPLLVLNNYVDKASIGIYTNAVTISNILSIIQTGFSAYWSPLVYENYKNKENNVKIKKIQRCAVFVLIFAALGIVLFQDIIYLLVGAEFRASKVFFPFLMLVPICNCIGDMLGIGIMLSKKSYLNLYTFAGSVVTNLACSFVLVPRIGVMGAAVAAGAAAIVMLNIRAYLGGRYYKPNDKSGFVIAGMLLLIAACVVNACVPSLLLRSALVLVLFAALCLVFKNELVYLASFALREAKVILKKVKP